MDAAPFAPDETGRLMALEELALVGTAPEPRFDRIVQLAMRLTEAPIGVFSLVEEIRVFFKARIGEQRARLSLGQPHRDYWFCSHAVATGQLVAVANARDDSRFEALAVVTSEPGLRAYCGAPVRAPGGQHVGVLGLFDVRPRTFNEVEQRAAADLARLIEAELSALPHATSDALTGALNPRPFRRIGDRVLEFGDARGRPSVVVRIDIDGIGAINQQFGFDEGDRALTDTVGLIDSVTRGSDFIGRIGADEFGVVLSGANEEEARAVLQRFEAAVEAHNEQAGRPYPLRFEIGHAVHQAGAGPDLPALLTVAALSAELG